MIAHAKAVGLAVALLMVVTFASACSGLRGTDDANFVTGDGSIVTFDPSDRGDPVAGAGDSLQGEPVDLAAERGQVVVLNFWASWCNPCREEAPVLAEASQQLDDVVFVGAQLREDNRGAAVQFENEFNITYPTIEDGGAIIAGMGKFAPYSQPSTAILDREGRVAVLINGLVPSVRTLEDLIEDVDG